ncbi:MAG: TolC family protein, partial [Bacteroidales bacterium]|nr:TolC family protein [Bacteroidales bacterium]
FLTSYKLDSLTVIAEQKIIEQKYKLQLSLFANAGLNAVYSPSLNRLGLSTGIVLSWNIFDGNQREIAREKSSVNLRTIEFDKKYFVTQNDISRNNILNQIGSLSQRITLSEEQINKYDKLLNVYNKEFEQGEITVMDYKNLLRDIASKKSENLLLKMEKQLLINSYNYWNY